MAYASNNAPPESMTRTPLNSTKGNSWDSAYRYGLILNGIGLLAWIALAASTWNADHALGGLFGDFFLMNLGLMLAACLNICLLVLACVNAFRTKNLLPLLYWGLLVGAEFGALRYHDYRFSLEVDAVKKQ